MTPENFLGRWALDRVIDDRKAGQRGTFEGVAEITGQGGADWLYHEYGTLVFATAAPMQAERRYLWVPDAGGIDISFEDGRFFHRLDLSGPHEAQHWCDPDDYHVRYDFSGWPVWRSRWDVSGPRKEYVMDNRYKRMG